MVLHLLPAAAWPYHDGPVAVRRPTGVVDSSGVRMFRTPGGQLADHPVLQAQYGLALVNSYRRTMMSGS
jgi:hypothetical protein